MVRTEEQHTTQRKEEHTIKKEHITIKKVRNYWKKNFRCGYCELEYIMRYKEPTYYNSGVYGWNCDIYTDYKTDIAITTGYRNMTGRQIPEELIEKYNKVAKNIIADSVSASYEEVKEALDQNRRNFFNELNNI